MNTVSSVCKWFAEHVRDDRGRPYLLDEEQATAVVDVHKNTLVSARAGAGKTHTLVAKIIYQIEVLGYESNQVMAFVFNRKAATEINDRLSGITVDGHHIVDEETVIARTFHSFAHSMVRVTDGRGSFGKILMDGEKRADTKNSRSLFIQAIIENIRDKDFEVAEAIQTFFRKESTTIDKAAYSTPEQYYEAMRNHEYRTLDGQSVRSYSEKIIADFFFEHGVKYRYEPEYYPRSLAQKGLSQERYYESLYSKDVIKGDFYLTKEKIVWEHWAVNGDEAKDEIERINESGVIGDYAKYMEQKAWKRQFYTKRWRNDVPEPVGKDVWYGYGFKSLVESHRPLSQSREEFEERIEQLCVENSIELKRYSRKVLIKKAWKKQVKYFTSMISSFIDRTQQQFFDDLDGLERIISRFPEDDEDSLRIKSFYKIGLKVYEEYLNRLSSRYHQNLEYVNDQNEIQEFNGYGADFSLLLQRSKQILANKSVQSRLSQARDIKLILVDEYQDFSRLFYDNLVGLRAIFPDAKLFCVGDDWQAINRFAGSDDSYFANFDQYFSENSKRLLISNNYRSAPEIVENANLVMQDLLGVDRASFAKPFNQNRGEATIQSIDISQYEFNDDPDRKSSPSSLEKYVEKISELIVRHKNDERILILHRKNSMLFNFNVWGVLRYKVRDRVTTMSGGMTKKKFDEKIRFHDDISDVMTVHRSKGLEGETVILLEADPKVFPSRNGSNDLYEIFGDTPETYMMDEARLYYVALTRAKKNLYVLWGTYEHDPQDKPAFIRALHEHVSDCN